MIPANGPARVLVTVKAAPQLSAKYRETVCVAGIHLPEFGAPELIRLYPIPFRYLNEDQQFQKYDIRTFNLALNANDARPESRKVVFQGPVEREQHLPPWRERTEIVEQIEQRTMCELLRAARAKAPGPSLGLVTPKEVEKILVRPTPQLTDEDRKARNRAHDQQELNVFGEAESAVTKVLEPPPFSAHLKYRCDDRQCPGHVQGIIDWELTALQRKVKRLGGGDGEIQRAIEYRFLEVPTQSKRVLRVFVGNQAKRRHVFGVLGLYYPERKDLPPAIGRLF